MKKVAVLALFGLLLCAVTACGGPGGAQPTSTPAPTPGVSDSVEASPPGESLSPAPSEAPSEENPPRQLDGEYQVDLNGDGREDTVRLYQVGLPAYREDGYVSWPEPGGDWLPCDLELEVVVDGQTYTRGWSWCWGQEVLFLEDLAGRTVCVVSIDAGGTGAGTRLIAPLVFDGGLVELSLPGEGVQVPGGSLHGFSGTAIYQDGWSVLVEVPETGFSGRFEAPHDAFYWEPGYEAQGIPRLFDEAGSCLIPGAEADFFDLFCYAGGEPVQVDGKDGLLVRQYISSISTAVGLGYLESVLTWDETGYVVLEQWVVSA